MGAIDQFQPSLLLLLESEQMSLPLEVQEEYKSLTSAVREAVQQNYEDLNSTLESLLPKVWKLRFEVLPLLLNSGISGGLNKTLVDLSLISKNTLH